MYFNKDGQFENSLQGNIIISDYDGSFSVVGIKAIVADLLVQTQHLDHWLWYQRPSPTAGITPEAINELIFRYSQLHKRGCVGLGVLNHNVLINSFDIPQDGSIKIPIKISKNEDTIFRFFYRLLNETESIAAEERKKRQQEAFEADAEVIMKKYEESRIKLGLTVEESDQILGTRKAIPSAQQLSLMQAISILERLISFTFEHNADLASDWLHSFQDSLGYKPKDEIVIPGGIHKIMDDLRDLKVN